MSKSRILYVEGKPYRWPTCSVAGCKNGACMGIPDTDTCFPHSGITHEMLDALRQGWWTWRDGAYEWVMP